MQEPVIFHVENSTNVKWLAIEKTSELKAHLKIQAEDPNGYDVDDSEVLTRVLVAFKGNGEVYSYPSKLSIFNQVMNSESIGKAVNSLIKDKTVLAKKLEENDVAELIKTGEHFNLQAELEAAKKLGRATLKLTWGYVKGKFVMPVYIAPKSIYDQEFAF